MTHIALQTLRAIDAAIEADGGTAFKHYQSVVLPHINDAYRADNDGRRSHLGASILGRDCAREIWYSYRWASDEQPQGRMTRLFNRGHLEEGRFISMLLTIGCQVYQQDEHGNQYRISFANGHAGGSGDGVVIGIPDVQPGLPLLSEFKTHGEKSFIELAGDLKEWRAYVAGKSTRFTGKGVRAAKWEHFVQMQIYMHKMSLAAALYVAVNKNTDDLYAEIVPQDSEIAISYLERGEKLVYRNTPPDKLNKSAGYYKCRNCVHRGVCHLGQAPRVSCRTCKHSYPDAESANWICGKFNQVLDKEAQMRACPHHEVQDDF